MQGEPQKARLAAGALAGLQEQHICSTAGSAPASAAAHVQRNGFYLGLGCSTALLNESYFVQMEEANLEVSVHLLMALL